MPSLLVALAVFAVGQDAREVRLTLGEKLADAHAIPVAYSPDARSLVFFKRGADRKSFSYWLADADGKNPRALFSSSVDMDDVLVGFSSPCLFSPDGKKLAVVTTRGGKGTREDPLRGGYCDRTGKLHLADVEAGFAGCAFAGDRFAFLDSAAFEKPPRPGYRLKLWDGKTTEVIHEDREAGAAILRASPDGSRVAFLVLDTTNKPLRFEFVLRVVDLKTKRAVDSEKFRSDDVTFDGPPLFYWDAEGKGLFYHKCPDEGGKTPFALMYFDVGKKKAERVLPEDNVAVVAILDKGHAAVLMPDRKRCGILRLSDRKVFPLPEGQIVFGGMGTRVVVADRKTRAVYCAELELPR